MSKGWDDEQLLAALREAMTACQTVPIWLSRRARTPTPGATRTGTGRLHDLGDVVVAAVVHAADLAVLGGPELGLLALELAVLPGDRHALAGPLAQQVTSNSAITARICRNMRPNGSCQS